MNAWTRVRMGFALIAGMVFGAGEVVAQSAACSEQDVTWSGIGVGAFHCPGGDCEFDEARFRVYTVARVLGGVTDTIRSDESGEPVRVSSFDFATEPALRAIDPDGPAAGRLEEGDVLLAVNGTIVTSARGGRALANLPLDRNATLTIRRGDEMIHADVRPRGRCGPPVLLLSEYIVGTRPRSGDEPEAWDVLWSPEGRRLELVPFLDTMREAHDSTDTVWQIISDGDGPWTSVGVDQSPWSYMHQDSAGVGTWQYSYSADRWRYVVSPDPMIAYRMIPEIRYSARQRQSQPSTVSWQDGLGIGVRCDGSCEMRWDGDGQSELILRGRVNIASVRTGGAADLAGLEPGDELIVIDGVRVESEEARLPIGELLRTRDVQLRVLRNGEELDLLVRVPRGG